MAELGRGLGIAVEVVSSTNGSRFVLQACRWVVERTFVWPVKHRRLWIGYEARARTGVAWIHAAMVRPMGRRTAKAT